MKVVKISSRTYFVRHWLKWYRVPSSGKNWEKLDTMPATFSLPRVVASNQMASEDELSKHIGLTK